MKQKRLIAVLSSLSIAVGLMFTTLVLARPSAKVALDAGEPTPADDRAGQLQSDDQPAGESENPDREDHVQEVGKTGQAVHFGPAYPLFVGINNISMTAYTIDVNNHVSSTAFSGVNVWGSAYDPANHRILFNDDSNLWEWAIGGTTSLLGTITDSGGGPITMHGLAYYEGKLFATSIATDQIYQIDLLTVEAAPIITLTDISASISGLAADPQSG